MYSPAQPIFNFFLYVSQNIFLSSPTQRSAMATTLMATTRPYVLLSSTRASLHLLFQSPKRPFASFLSTLSCAAAARSSSSRCLSAVLSRGETAAPSSSIFGKGVSGFGVVDIRSRGFSARSSQINDAGSIDQTLMQSMELKVRFLNLCVLWFLMTLTLLSSSNDRRLGS